MEKEQENQFELAPGVTEELMEPEYINDGWLIEQPQKVYRVDNRGKRYYYVYADDGLPTFHMSVTSFIKSALPTSPQLIDWIVSMGKDAAHAYMMERAHFGTFMHIECAELLKGRTYDLDALGAKLEQYMVKHDLSRDFKKHEDELRKSILAFAQFMIDYNVVPIAIEIILAHRKYRIAGAIDVILEMDHEVYKDMGSVYKTGPRKGQVKMEKVKERIRAVLDLKSGKNFYESHAIQLGVYMDMWNSWFPDLQVSKAFNWAPSDWRGTTPTYKLKDQTDSAAIDKIPHLVSIASVNEKMTSSYVTLMSGVIDIDRGVHANIESVDMINLVKRKKTDDAQADIQQSVPDQDTK